MRRLGAVVLACALLAGSAPLERRLRAAAPGRPAAADLGTGRLLGGMLTGAFRPLLRTYLYLRADTLYGRGRFDELHALFRAMLALYPENTRAQVFLAWNLAFNLKSEAPDRRLAWRWAREGLEILTGLEEGLREAAYWCLAQCGQNALDPERPLRYAGPEWERERWWRARLRAWSRKRFGRPLDRFALGMHLLRGRTGLLDLLWRTVLARERLLDDWTRTGRSEAFDEAREVFALYRARIAGLPALLHAAEETWARLERLRPEADSAAACRTVAELPAEPPARLYRYAMALLGTGRASGDRARVEAARRALERLDAAYRPDRTDFAEELRLASR